MSASLVLAAGVGAHLELLTVMLGCAAVVLLMRWRRREQGPLRWYLVPGGVDVVIQHRLTQVRVERFRPRDTLLYVAQTPKGWKVTLMPRESGDVTSTGLTLQQAQALLAAWQSPLEPLPLERCEIYGC